MTRLTLLLPALLVAAHAHAQGVLENPARNTTQSGIGVVSGWHCTAREIRIQIDEHPPLVAGSGTERLDTRAVCGHANTGFSLLFNWNLLDSDRTHTIKAFADGREFATTAFSAANFGAEFLKGKTARYELKNFPEQVLPL